MHTCITYLHTYLHAYIHTYIHIHIHMYMDMCMCVLLPLGHNCLFAVKTPCTHVYVCLYACVHVPAMWFP